MRSSYKKNNYEKIFKLLAFIMKPTKCVEFGILDGYSLRALAEHSPANCNIEAYDIFEEFPGNAADYNNVSDKFKQYENVSIKRGDFYQSHKDFEDGSIDILHIDIANNGDTYKHVAKEYMKKLSKQGICILEGGSEARDDVYWMKEYNKPRIIPALKSINKEYHVYTIDEEPSMTFIMNKQEK